MPNYKVTYNGPSSVIWAKPTDFKSTFRVTQASKPKSAGKQMLDNVVTELKLVDRTIVEKPVGCTDCTTDYDYTSVTLTISGSVQNHTKVAAIVQQLFANYEIEKEDILAGFIGRDAVLPII